MAPLAQWLTTRVPRAILEGAEIPERPLVRAEPADPLRVGPAGALDQGGGAPALAQQLLQRPRAEHRARLLGDDVAAGAGVVVAALDQQPLRTGAGGRPLQGESAGQLLAVEHEHGVSPLERLGPGDPAALLIGATIPHDHRPAPPTALKGAVADLVIRDLDRQPPDGRVQGGPLRHRPRAHHRAHLEAQVEVVRARGVLLHDEPARADSTDRELLVALGGHIGALESGHPSSGRTLGQELEQAIDGIGPSLGVYGDGSVGFVANPSPQAERESAVLGGRAEADALHRAPDGEPQRPCRPSCQGLPTDIRELRSRRTWRKFAGFLGVLAVSPGVQDSVSSVKVDARKRRHGQWIVRRGRMPTERRFRRAVGPWRRTTQPRDWERME